MTIFYKIMTIMKFGTVTMPVAFFAVTLMARADGASAHLDYKIFPTNSIAQCVIDGKALEDFPPMARLKDAFGAKGQLVKAAAGEAFLLENVSYYAVALLPAEAKAQTKGKHLDADEEDGDDFTSVAYIGFSTNITTKVLEEIVGTVMKSTTLEDGGAIVTKNLLPDGLIKFSVTNASPKAKGVAGNGNDLPEAIYLARADDSLAVAAPEEHLVRKVVGDIRAGRVFRPSMPAKRPFFWLSAEIDPDDFFGDDGDEDDDEPSPLETMPFLGELSRITATAEGVAKDESILVVLSARFSSPKSATAAADALRPLLAFLPKAGGDSLAQLAARAKVGVSGRECSVTITFSREDIGQLVEMATPASP